MQKCSEPSGFLANSMGAPQGEEDGCIALESNNSTNCFFIINHSLGLYQYMNFYTGWVPPSRGILYISPSFQLGSIHVGNVPGKTSQYLHNTIHNDALFFSSTFSKCGIAPSGRSLSPYNTS